jgi:hypothetical protein
MQACGAFKTLASLSDENRRRLGDAGACECLVNVLRVHAITSASVAKQACAAMRNLTANNEENRARLVAAGACESTVDVLKRHTADKPSIVEKVRRY